MTMFDRFLQYIFPRRRDRRGLTVAGLNRMDTAVSDESAFDCEKVIVINGEVFGETAIITGDSKLQPTGGPLPPQSIAPFPFHSSSLTLTALKKPPLDLTPVFSLQRADALRICMSNSRTQVSHKPLPPFSLGQSISLQPDILSAGRGSPSKAFKSLGRVSHISMSTNFTPGIMAPLTAK